MESERLTYDVAKAAKLLGLSRNAAYQGCLTGQIPHIKVGKRILIPKQMLDVLLSGEVQKGERIFKGRGEV